MKKIPLAKHPKPLLEMHNPLHESDNGVYAFCRHSSAPTRMLMQKNAKVSIQDHDKLGQVVTLIIEAKLEADKGNTVIVHIPIKQLAEWVAEGIPEIPFADKEQSDQLTQMAADLAMSHNED